MDHQKLENSSRDGNTRPFYLPPDKLYAGQAVTVGTGHGTTDWFQIRKGIHQSCILSPCLFNLHPGLISFRMDWLNLLAVQGTLKSLLQHHSSKASILPCSAFFTVQLSHAYMTTEKTIALTRQTFVGKVMSLLLNMPSRLVITFLQAYFNFMAAITICSDFWSPKK